MNGRAQRRAGQAAPTETNRGQLQAADWGSRSRPGCRVQLRGDITTGGASTMSIEERVRLAATFKLAAASLLGVQGRKPFERSAALVDLGTAGSGVWWTVDGYREDTVSHLVYFD